MIVFPNAKINIGLNVVSKRTDGYHNLETIFYPLKLADALEIAESEKTTLTISGIPIDGYSEDNLILKAYRLLKKDFNLPPVKFHLHKIIPYGAGLGGGSSDAAFTLKMLNEYFNLALSIETMENYASQIGADCPFFIKNKPVFATGTGNRFQALELDLSAYQIVVLKPEISVNTANAYKNINPGIPEKGLTELINSPIDTWKTTIKNDFEKNIFGKYAEIAQLKELLYGLGAVYASMSGSGSAVFGIFAQIPAYLTDRIPNGIFIYR